MLCAVRRPGGTGYASVFRFAVAAMKVFNAFQCQVISAHAEAEDLLPPDSLFLRRTLQTSK
jgi:hypothetical protein